MKKRIGNIPIIKPLFDAKEINQVKDSIESGWVAQGPKVEEFERMVASYVGSKYAVATTSATTSLHLSLYLLGIGQGDEVIVPSFSFIATTNVIVHVGATPVFVDIDSKTYNIDPKDVEKKITKKTKAIIPVDQVGLPYDIDEINKIARKHGLFVIEDAAPALGSKYKGKMIGGINTLACFSFHPRKVITTGEGGMITTNNRGYEEKLKMLRHHGMGISDLRRHKSKKVVHEKYPFIGYNFRMSDVQAAIGIEQMKKLPGIIKKRQKLAARYDKAFSRSENIIPPYIPDYAEHNRQTYVIRLKKNSKTTRDQLMQKLLNKGISTRRGVMAAHLEPCYKKLVKKVGLPETEKATKETIAIPLYPQMTIKEQGCVIGKILDYGR